MSKREPFGGGYVKVVELLYSESATRGAGVPGDPVRIIQQLWSKDGSLIAEHDVWSGQSWFEPIESATAGKE